jgi:hypothetical protein
MGKAYQREGKDLGDSFIRKNILHDLRLLQGRDISNLSKAG